jgi:predicted TIM-barrel fold metal-dependent hydrolase
MIIDAHAHIGHWETSDFTPEYVIRLMRGSGVDLALVSNLEGIGRDTDQTQANERTRQAVLAYPDKLRGLVWINPWLADRALKDARGCLEAGFVGLKFHPFHNSFYFHSPHVRPFVQLAREYQAPVAVHTAFDDYSRPEYVVAVAAEFSDVKFILFHAGLNPPDAATGIQVFQQAAAHSNLYTDISWLDLDRLHQAMDIMPIERLLFGTDVPLGGEEHYRDYFEKLAALGLNSDQWTRLVETNSRNVFKL